MLTLSFSSLDSFFLLNQLHLKNSGPFLNQLNAMSEKKTGASKGGSKRR